MTQKNPRYHFEAHPSESITLARRNLADVTRFRVETFDGGNIDIKNIQHLLGNLSIATFAAGLSFGDKSPGEQVAASVAEVGGDYEKYHNLFDYFLLDNKSITLVCGLSYIPDDAPEVKVTKRSKVLLVDEFLHQAHLLNSTV